MSTRKWGRLLWLASALVGLSALVLASLAKDTKAVVDPAVSHVAKITPVKTTTSHHATDASTTTTDASKNETILYRLSNGTALQLPRARSLLHAPPPFGKKSIVRLTSQPLTASPNTIVTAYFRIPSKHGSKAYDVWMKNFLSLRDHMVIFTNRQMFAQIHHLRNRHAAQKTVIILMDLEDIPYARLYPREFWEDQLERDYEKAMHKSLELFWIWLNKSWCVAQAIKYNFFDSDLFLWSDIGGDREGTYAGKTLIQHREVVPRHEMMQMAFKIPVPPPNVDFFDDKKKHIQHFFHSGMHLVGYKNTWKKFHKYFLDMIDRFLENNMLLVDDQVVLQSVCLSHPEICAYVLCSETPDARYRAIRYVLHHGGEYHLWRYNKTSPAFDGSKYGPIRNKHGKCQYQRVPRNITSAELKGWCGTCPAPWGKPGTCDERVEWLKKTYNTDPSEAMANMMGRGDCKMSEQ